MTSGHGSGVLPLLQPDLLTVEELISNIQSRFRIKNLELTSKEGLVGLFRRVILPLPQRFYRANRRGKMLTSRRAKAGLESRKKEEGFRVEASPVQSSAFSNRLKPPPNVHIHSRKIRINSDKKIEKMCSAESNLDSIIIKDRRKLREVEKRKNKGEYDSEIVRRESSAEIKNILKRGPVEEKQSSESTPSTESKRQRKTIKWP